MKVRFTFLCIIMSTFAFCDKEENPVKPQENDFPVEQDFLPAAPDGKKWELIWNDEFEGSELDTLKWEHVSWVAPGEDQPRKDGYWREDAAVLDSRGCLKMLTYYDSQKKRYIDGAVRTRGKFEKAFGYYEARIQLQNEVGHWSAFWLMCDGVASVGDEGKDGTEIDIMEKISPNDDRVFQTLHWDGYGDDHQSAHREAIIPGVRDGFHTFGLWWTSEEYIFYIDGKETWRTKAGEVCQVPVYIKISDEVGEWAGKISQADLPDFWLVDYVRVFDLINQ